MASVFPDELMGRLLERLDTESIPILSGGDVSDFPPSALSALLEERLLRELAPLDELSSCDCAIDDCRRIIQRDGAKAWAFCANGSATPLEMNPEHLRQFEVGIAVLCQRLREVNQLGGDAVSSYGRTIHFLGDTDAGGRRVSLVLARCLRSGSADRTLHAIRGRWPERSLLVLTPTPLALDPGLRANLKSNEVVVAGISELLVNPASFELALGRISGLFAWSPALGPGVILYADKAAHEMRFRGEALTLAPREFKLLLLFLESAVKNPRGWVSRRTIHDALWPECASGGLVYDLQIHDAIKKVRRALNGVEPGTGSRLIKMQRGAGYRLATSVRSIAVV